MRDGVICVDIDSDFLEFGKTQAELVGLLNNRYIAASAKQTTLEDESVDALINAYALFYMGQDQDGRSEVEDAVLEANRILKVGAEKYIGLPYTMDVPILDRFSTNMQAYGFELTARLTPKETSQVGMTGGLHALRFRKVARCNHKLGLDLSFYEGRVRLAI